MTAHQHSAPFDEGFLRVSDIHTLHYEQYGNLNGKPVLFLHGGPGGSTSVANTAYFNPSIYRVVLFDQRGAGKSIPAAEFRENTTQHLIADNERLRAHLKIDIWHVVFGGSWGSTLALLYAEAFPERVKSLVLRGIFLATRHEVEWDFPLRGYGPSEFFPDAAEEYLSHYTEEEQKDWENVTYKRLTEGDKPTRIKTARALNIWDITRGSHILDPSSLEKVNDEKWSLQHAILEFVYLYHGCFIRENQILEEIEKIKHIPCIIVNGRYDMICPPLAAWDLHRAMPLSRIVITSDSGHSATDPGTFRELVKACDEFAEL